MVALHPCSIAKLCSLVEPQLLETPPETAQSDFPAATPQPRAFSSMHTLFSRYIRNAQDSPATPAGPQIGDERRVVLTCPEFLAPAMRGGWREEQWETPAPEVFDFSESI